MDKKQLLHELEEQIKICQKCRLCETAKNAVPGEGNYNAEIVFIGEAPGANEDDQGRPFIGRAGQLLDSLITEIGHKRSDVWIGNIIKHRPPKNRDPLPDELEACQPYLTTQLNILKPKLIVTLGRFSMNYFLPDAKIGKAHGQVYESGVYNIYPVYHPAAALRNSAMKNTLIMDFLKIPSVLKELNGRAPSPLTSSQEKLKSKVDSEDNQNQVSQINLI